MQPIPQSSRLPVSIMPLRDLTGQYKTIAPSFEETAKYALKNDYVIDTPYP
jgi:hypothetical protein